MTSSSVTTHFSVCCAYGVASGSGPSFSRSSYRPTDRIPCNLTVSFRGETTSIVRDADSDCLHKRLLGCYVQVYRGDVLYKSLSLTMLYRIVVPTICTVESSRRILVLEVCDSKKGMRSKYSRFIQNTTTVTALQMCLIVRTLLTPYC